MPPPRRPRLRPRTTNQAPDRPPRRPSLRTGAACLLGLVGCATYEPVPLEQVVEVDRAAALRESAALPEGVDAVDFATAQGWLVERNPALQRARAAWRAAARYAEVDSPLPDPQIQVGPRYGFGSDVGTSIWTGFLQTAFTIPSGDRRAVQDALDDARAELDLADALGVARDEVLRLRGGLARLALARARLAELEELAASADRAAELVRRGLRAGSTTALDAALADLEAARARAVVLEARELELEARHSVAALTGVPAARFARLAPELTAAPPASAPDPVRLRDLLARQHPELARRRAAYVVAEHELHLQVELSRPDVQVAPSYTGENGDDIHVLQLGFQFSHPVFDGNVKGIRAAEVRREELREDFRATASALLADLDAARAGVELARERVTALRDGLLPIADRSAELAARAVEAGAADALRVLAVERAARELRADALSAELDLVQRWTALERAVGAPLYDYAGLGPGAVLDAEGARLARAPEGVSGDEGSNTEQETQR